MSRRPFPLVVRVGTLAWLSFCCLLPVFPPTELPFPLPVSLFTMHRLCLDLGVLSPAVGLHGPAFPDAVTSLLYTSLLCAHPCRRRQ